jgi:hypothetical protein
VPQPPSCPEKAIWIASYPNPETPSPESPSTIFCASSSAKRREVLGMPSDAGAHEVEQFTGRGARTWRAGWGSVIGPFMSCDTRTWCGCRSRCSAAWRNS